MSPSASPLGDQAHEWVHRACPLCGADNATVFADAEFDAGRLDDFAFASRKTPDCMHYRLLSCRSCGLLYASPVPPVDRLVGAYQDAAFDSGDEAAQASRTYANVLRSHVVTTLPDRIGALDIGTGDGAFLHHLLAEGFTGVMGIEPSAAPIHAARRDVRPLIRQGVFEPGSFEGASLRLVTCFQTLEHVYEPLRIVKDVHRILKEDGAAFFVCHNSHSLSARVLGMRSPIFDVEHLQLFSARTARLLLERAGFADISVLPIVNRYALQYWTRLFPMPGAVKRACLAWLRATRLGAVTIPFPAGNLAAVGYKR